MIRNEFTKPRILVIIDEGGTSVACDHDGVVEVCVLNYDSDRRVRAAIINGRKASVHGGIDDPRFDEELEATWTDVLGAVSPPCQKCGEPKLIHHALPDLPGVLVCPGQLHSIDCYEDG